MDLFIRPLLFALYSILKIVSWSSTFRASQEYKDERDIPFYRSRRHSTTPATGQITSLGQH
jgi:hypothetical protein